MGRTRIFIPSSGDIEMYDDVSTPLNFSIADIRNPEKRNSNYSKTIKIPGTKSNNLLFGNIFDVNISDGAFNPNAKVKASLVIDDEEQINGYLQLLNIIILDDNKIEYEVTIVGNVGSIFSALGNAELTALNMSDYDHTYDYATQVASWTNNHGDGYCYPLIDYGFDGDLSKVNVEHLFPSIFLKTYITKIFESVGYTYTSTFFDSSFFENLIVPSNAVKVILLDAQIAQRLFEADQTIATVGTLANVTSASDTGLVTLIFDSEINDPSNQYNTATGEWTVSEAGYYNIFSDHICTTSTSAPGGSGLISYRILRNGTQIGETAGAVPVNGTFTIQIGMSSVYLDAGDVITIASRFYILGTGLTGTISYNNGTFRNTVSNIGLIEGDTLVLNQAIPNKIKQKDLLLCIIKKFNLYVDVDPNNDRNLLIETRDDFYAGGSVKNWTDKLDHSKPIEYRPMGDLDYKEFNYTYADDTDYFNKKYKDTYQETYGRYRHITDNEFLTGISENKSIFSPTPLIGDTASDRVISRIWDVDASNLVKSKAFNIRLLYRGGVLTSNVSYEYTGRFTGTAYQTQYLYAGHVDLPSLPTLDLCFGVPKEIYYYATYYTNNNIFNKYHKKFIDEITDRDSKIVTAYFYLRKGDIRTLSFKDQYYFDNEYFRLNKIYDHDPLKHEVTKCEFIKVKDRGRFTPSLAIILGGYSTAFGSETAPILSEPGTGTTYSNVTPVGAARAMVGGGGDNILDSALKSCIILGNDNVVGNSENVTLVGSSGNIIGSGLKNVTLINTFGKTITESNTIYINGSLAPTEGDWTPTLTSVANISNSTNYLCQYYRIGNRVSCFGRVDLQATITATTTRLGVSLPVASDFTNNYDLAGTAYAPAVAGMGMAVRADTTNDRAEITFTSSDTNSQQVFFTFSYVIK